MRKLWQSILTTLAKGLGFLTRPFRRQTQQTRATEPRGTDAAGPAVSRPAQHLAEGGTAGSDQAQPPAAANPAELVKQAVERAGGTGAAPRRAVRSQLAALGLTQPAAQHQAMAAAVSAGVVQALPDGSLRLPAQAEPAGPTTSSPSTSTSTTTPPPAGAAGPVTPAPSSTTPTSTSSTATQGEPSSLARLVADAAREHGGDYNLAPMARIRAFLHRAGVQTRSHQDLAIREARQAGLVSRPRPWRAARRYRGGGGPPPCTSPDRREPREPGLGFLSLRGHRSTLPAVVRQGMVPRPACSPIARSQARKSATTFSSCASRRNTSEPPPATSTAASEQRKTGHRPFPLVRNRPWKGFSSSATCKSTCPATTPRRVWTSRTCRIRTRRSWRKSRASR